MTPPHLTFCHSTLDTARFGDRVEAAAGAGVTGLALDFGRHRAFRARGESDADMLAARRATLTEAELAELFDLGYHFKTVDTVFARVFGQQA